ncbi:MAG: 2Fe-2S iron-sulfur cluster-binding protein [Leptonema sp. (in: bacteria)]
MSLLSIFKKEKHKPKIQIKPISVECEIESNKTILQSLLDQGIQFPHNCRVGSCTTCASKLIEGKVKELTDKAFVLSEEQLKENYILVCQSIPKSEFLVIENQKLQQKEEKIPAKIIEKKLLTHDIIELTILLEEPVFYKAGQYINFIFDWLDRPRSYSMANRPNSKGIKQLKFFIRHVPKGKFTEWLFNLKDIEIEFYVSQPEGNFYLRNSTKPMILIAGGSGLSPIYSILEDIIFNQDLEINKKQILRDVVLLFGVRTQKDLYKIEELENFKNYWKGKFEIIPVLSEEKDSDWKGKTGFVHEILDQLPNISNSQLYMCGPPIMIDKCIEVAQKHGLSSNEIYFDKFTDSSHIIKV